MEKIRRIAFCIMLASMVCITAACGRNNRNNMAGTSGAGGASSGAGAGTPTQTGTSGYGESQGMNSTNGETGGVLRDMVDDVGNGVNNITNDVLGTTGAGTNGNERHERKRNKRQRHKQYRNKRYEPDHRREKRQYGGTIRDSGKTALRGQENRPCAKLFFFVFL